MKIFHIAAEMAHVAKVGGLADVVFGLAQELTSQGTELIVILPKYDLIEGIDLQIQNDNFMVPEGDRLIRNTVWSGKIGKIPLLLIEDHHPDGYFHRNTIYGETDDNDRFLYFSKAALTYLQQENESIDIIHLHDWHTAIIPLLYREGHFDFVQKGFVLTIHNASYQGRCTPEKLDRIGLDGRKFLTQDTLQDSNNSKQINLLKGGIKTSDQITTVSPTYAKEILDHLGHGLEVVLNEEKGKLTGILNGIDTAYWNPETDPLLIATYPPLPDRIEGVISGKKMNKSHLIQQLNMPSKDVPLTVCISRLATQKGPKLIQEGIKHCLELGGQFVLLGSAFDQGIFKEFESLRDTLKDHPDVHFHFEYDEKLAHLLFAAADFILIPSLFEPCGLTQLYAMRYGAIPIAAETGGLCDTVFDENTPHPTGYLFQTSRSGSMKEALERAHHEYSTHRNQQLVRIQNGLSSDYSWHHATKEYLKIYDELFSNQA